MLYKQTNMFHLLSLLASILTGLRATFAQVAPRSRARIPVLTPPWDHIDHMFACFERLYADWCRGILPESRERTDLPGAGVACPPRRVRVLPDPTMTAPRTPTPPPSASPHPRFPHPARALPDPRHPLAARPAPHHRAKPA